ncbi:SUKH-3 domain-containing protein [Burkholderia contaminans]|nr:SUKH-3 domain-containing protein [Burkholderia contaminans]
MIEIPSTVRPLFVAAGWRGDAEGWVSSHDGDHPGNTILRAFDGLIVGTDRADRRGETCARMGFAFHALAHQDRQIAAWEQALGTTMIGVAEDDLGYVEFYVDAQGRVFATNCVVDGVYLCGFTFGEAVERTLCGRVAIPLVLDDRATIAYYGEDLSSDDPRVMTAAQILAGREG